MNPWLSVKEALHPIHRPPSGDRRDAWVHHGFRALLVLIIALIMPWLFPRDSLPEFDGLQQGTVADRDVIAEFGFSVPKDPAQLVQEQEAAALTVPTIVESKPSLADSARLRVREFFARLDTVVARANERADEEELGAEDRESLVRGAINDVLTPRLQMPEDAQLGYLVSQRNRSGLEDELNDALGTLGERGAISDADRAQLQTANVVIREGQQDRVAPLESLNRLSDVQADLVGDATGSLSPLGSQLFNALLIYFAEPTMRRDVEAMLQARQQARNAVSTTSGDVLEGERIITQYELIGPFEYRRLVAYENALIEQGRNTASTFRAGLGTVLLASALLGILVFSTYTFRREIYEDVRSFSVLLGLILLVLAAGGLAAGLDAPDAVVPVAFAGLLAAALFDSLLGVVVVSVVAGLLLTQPAFEGLPVPMMAVAGGVTAAFAVRGLRSRSQSWVLIALITGAYMFASLCLILTSDYAWQAVAVNSVTGFANATICVGLAMGAVLPALEKFTRRTTDQSLLELADMNRPLLRRLAREAPGTYAHSINMANLVEAACEAIEANALVTRVGVYYHDVGKLQRPQYFIENQPKGLNPHDRLTPWQSAEILRAHVYEGIEIAREAKLPEIVQDFIREHHGTQQIRYFLRKARELEGAEAIDPNDFVYPGPKPQTKETAIACLADAVESASRALPEPTPERIRALIHNLVEERADQGELDECGLTFRDLDRVKRAFARVLTGLYHHRIDYPKPGIAGEGVEHAGREPAFAPDPDATVPGQMTIDLELAAQSDTGPPPRIEPSRPTAVGEGRDRSG